MPESNGTAETADVVKPKGMKRAMYLGTCVLAALSALAGLYLAALSVRSGDILMTAVWAVVVCLWIVLASIAAGAASGAYATGDLRD